MRPARSPSGTTAPTSPRACRKLDTMPRAESVRVPSRSKITNCGRAPTVLGRVSVTTPLSPTSPAVPVAGLAGNYCRAVSVQLADVIDVIDAAYPPRLALDWDSVVLV